MSSRGKYSWVVSGALVRLVGMDGETPTLYGPCVGRLGRVVSPPDYPERLTPRSVVLVAGVRSPEVRALYGVEDDSLSPFLRNLAPAPDAEEEWILQRALDELRS